MSRRDVVAGRLCAPRAREAEVHDLERAIGLDPQAARLERAMHDAFGVDLRESQARVMDERDRVRRGQRHVEVVPVVQLRALEVLHQDVPVLVRSEPAVVHLDDVPIRQAPEHRDLPQRATSRILRHDRVQRHLEIDRLREGRRTHLVDPRLRILPQHALDAEVAVDIAGLELERHRRMVGGAAPGLNRACPSDR
jgi:hypothetical protein